MTIRHDLPIRLDLEELRVREPDLGSGGGRTRPDRAGAVLLTYVCALSLVGQAACNAGRGGELTPEVAAQWARDSAAYDRELSTWLRDSAVIDSVAKAVPTDSLARLWGSMLRAKRPEIVLERVACEYQRLSDLYGVAGELAAKRIEDSMYSRHVFAAARMELRFPNHGFEVGESCTLGGPRGPDTVSGTSIRDDLPPRPRPPRRPRS